MEDSKRVPSPPDEDSSSNSNSVEDFFLKLKPEMRRPKPSDEAVEAARLAIERLEMQSMRRDEMSPEGAPAPSATGRCPICGSGNPAQNQFCGACGSPLPAEQTAPSASPQTPSGKHHYHHHYHHHFLAGGTEGGMASLLGGGAAAKRESPRTTSLGSGAPASLSRAEANIRKLVQDWALAGNTKKLDDVVELYAPDALVMRSNHPTVRGTVAIREFFCAALDAGLGDIEMDPVRIAVTGDLAFEAGRCKMLVPVAVGKRREERGKYVLVFARQSNGEWLITVDCWSSDLSLKVGPEPEAARATFPVAPASKPPKRGP